MLRTFLFTVLFFTGVSRTSAQIGSGNCLWFGLGPGLAAADKTVMAHVMINAVYLRHDQWGLSLRAEANGRLPRRAQANRLHS